MQPGGLVDRLRRIPDLGCLPILEAFDPGNDLHLDEAARLLLGRFREHNDTESFTLLYELTHERLRQIATQLTRRISPAADPDDLASAFMVRLFSDTSSRPQAPVRRFLALAATSMRNSVFDQLRQQQRARAGGQLFHDSLDQPPDPADTAQQAEEDRALQRCGQHLVSLTDECFHALEARDKQVLVAREILGLSYERVAILLGLEAAQVGMIIRRARKHLAERIVARLEALGTGDAGLVGASALVRRCLESREQVKSVQGLVQRMLDAAVAAGHRRLADLVYEMAKACLVGVPDFEQRMLVHDSPRRRSAVAEDLRHLGARLAAADSHAARREAQDVSDVARHALSRDAALADGLLCLQALERLEGCTGRQQVALALHHIHAGRPAEAEAILRALVDADIPAVTRQNVFRNLTLALLRQDRWQDALEIAEASGADWPDDPVRLMNLCFATARLGDRPAFEAHAQRLVAFEARAPQPRVQAWIGSDLPSLAAAVGMGPGAFRALVTSATAGHAPEAS